MLTNGPDCPCIINLSNKHSQAIIDIILPIQQDEFGINITLSQQPDLLNIEKFYLKDGGIFLGAIYQERLCGTLALLRFERSLGAIRKMFVTREFRGKNLALADSLMDALIDDCLRKGIEGLYLGTVDVLKAAIRFYQKRGFEQIEEENLPQSFPRMSQDNMFFHLNLKSPINHKQ